MSRHEGGTVIQQRALHGGDGAGRGRRRGSRGASDACACTGSRCRQRSTVDEHALDAARRCGGDVQVAQRALALRRHGEGAVTYHQRSARQQLLAQLNRGVATVDMRYEGLIIVRQLARL